jgi:hypothetical protein
MGQIKGKFGCVVCIDGTCYTYLSASKKLVYMRHMRFLPTKHRYQHPSMKPYWKELDISHRGRCAEEEAKREEEKAG